VPGAYSEANRRTRARIAAAGDGIHREHPQKEGDDGAVQRVRLHRRCCGRHPAADHCDAPHPRGDTRHLIRPLRATQDQPRDQAAREQACHAEHQHHADQWAKHDHPE
jgi:hypothetical protein